MSLKGRTLRHKRIRKKLIGTSKRPRLCVFRSLKHLSAQFIDDVEGKTLYSLSTNSKSIRAKVKYGGNVKAATVLGEELAKNAKTKGFTSVIFDRAGYQYHGRIKSLADACRKGGLQF